jgi:hypothetical protein
MNAPIRHCDVKFAYECPKEWSRLEATDREDVRFCRQCSKEVFFCRTTDEATAHARAGRCVAIDAEEKAEERKKDSMYGKLTRIRKPRVGLFYVVEDDNKFDEGMRSAPLNLGQVVDEELKRLRADHAANDAPEEGGDPGAPT